MSVRAFSKFLASLSLFACASVFAAPLVINVSGIQSNGELFDPANPTFNYQVGANASVIGISYSVTMTAFDPSYLSEMGFVISDSGVNEGILFNFGFGVDEPGTALFAETLDLIAEGLSFNVGADGLLRLEFYEDYVDDISPNGIWDSGFITITFAEDTVPPSTDVPEPATGLLLCAGLAALGYTSRRRRAAAAV
ncbi:PEP-CTERM sorting domain-containing protein [Massilia sp. DWR3-1-1]|uniref:PEP-CTERM sorting domain-containing protein n=1 Tax=Massilia sp. DWR3-1-1 TaxID=2804559 RepID=UPI003CFBBE6C